MERGQGDRARALRLWQAWVLYRVLTFFLGAGLLLALGASLMGLWWMGIPLAVGSMLGYDYAVTRLLRRG